MRRRSLYQQAREAKRQQPDFDLAPLRLTYNCCCERARLLGVQICPDCAWESAGYSAAMNAELSQPPQRNA